MLATRNIIGYIRDMARKTSAGYPNVYMKLRPDLQTLGMDDDKKVHHLLKLRLEVNASEGLLIDVCDALLASVFSASNDDCVVMPDFIIDYVSSKKAVVVFTVVWDFKKDIADPIDEEE